MHAVLVEFTVKNEHAGAFLERVRQQARDSIQNEPGCHVFDVCVDPDARHDVILYEVYENAAAFDDHLNSDHFRAFDREVSDWIEAKRVAQYHRL